MLKYELITHLSDVRLYLTAKWPILSMNFDESDLSLCSREAVVTQSKSNGQEEQVGVLGHSDYFGEIALLFDR